MRPTFLLALRSPSASLSFFRVTVDQCSSFFFHSDFCEERFEHAYARFLKEHDPVSHFSPLDRGLLFVDLAERSLYSFQTLCSPGYSFFYSFLTDPLRPLSPIIDDLLARHLLQARTFQGPVPLDFQTLASFASYHQSWLGRLKQALFSHQQDSFQWEVGPLVLNSFKMFHFHFSPSGLVSLFQTLLGQGFLTTPDDLEAWSHFLNSFSLDCYRLPTDERSLDAVLDEDAYQELLTFRALSFLDQLHALWKAARSSRLPP